MSVVTDGLITSWWVV